MTTDTGLIERAAEVYRELGDVLTDEERWTQTHFLKARNIISDLSDRVSVLADEVLRASMAMLRKNNGALLTELSRAPEAGWVMVPKEPTREMVIAAHARDHDGTTSLYHKIWAAMIAAASPAPAQARPPAVCHVCGEQTETACADCQITFSATVYVCSKASCRDAHERKCFGPGNSAPPPAEARELVSVERAVLEQAKSVLDRVALSGKKFGPIYSHALTASHGLGYALRAALSPASEKTAEDRDDD